MSRVTEPEDVSLEQVIRELAEILAGGFLRVRGRGASLGDNASTREGSGGVTDDTANGFSARNLPS